MMVYSCSRILVSIFNELTGEGIRLDCQLEDTSIYIVLSEAKQSFRLYSDNNVKYINIKILRKYFIYIKLLIDK